MQGTVREHHAVAQAVGDVLPIPISHLAQRRGAKIASVLCTPHNSKPKKSKSKPAELGKGTLFLLFSSGTVMLAAMDMAGAGVVLTPGLLSSFSCPGLLGPILNKCMVHSH